MEPFVGGGAVFLNCDFAEYRLSDINPDLIAFYQELQRHGTEFIDELSGYFDDAHNTPQVYYRLRDQFNRCRSKRLRAQLFFYLTRHAYNSLFRVNSSGQMNTPFGRYSKVYFPRAELHAFHHRAQWAEFAVGDYWRQCYRLRRPDTVVYMDPPYAPLARGGTPVPRAETCFTGYAAGGFTWQDHCRLAQLAQLLRRRGMTVILSNHDSPECRALYKDAIIRTTTVHRSVGAKAGSRRPAAELIAIYAP